ncbi:DUF4105 domain-containing protein [Photobacterium sp. WH77]|uniref:Lnb N-terminal periplasmic domain-containing protein n=1 Tax=unclassified Photobacterium TaxID=2628852 RepID=UPI001EDB6220|nr:MULTISPECIES: DUF4105 domain-containing protein [unclassified Photobacterium]MCG2837961.1 DUF4105 domain-containing protein [Photobacterium sp. WH77]MCG2845579.1 DUF4105 domain-containing protein [Photobacterium sp. WH80]
MKFWLSLLPLSVFSSTAFAYTQQDLVHLSTSDYWHTLGHYQPGLTGSFTSLVDSPSFFVSPQGKDDPLAELNATVEGFEREAKQSDSSPNDQSLSCRYPARFHWLKQKLHTDWPVAVCPEQTLWKQALNPKGLTLVFPTAFMNSPSSMFGHTLLRVDAKDQNRNRELVAFAINFAATPESNDNAFLYAAKGLFGNYPGTFSVMPYYRKVREYNDLESRDIWEYALNLDEEEVQQVLRHLWEMNGVEFDYYFIDENCSYQLLALLEAGREGLDLTSGFDYRAIPSDTVKVLRENGLIEVPKYRASFGTRLMHYAEQLDDQQLLAARAAMTGQYPTEGSLSERAAILEMAYEWLNFEFYDQALAREDIAPQLQKLLIARSKLNTSSPFSEPVKPAMSPDEGHNSSRLGLGYRYSNHNADQALLEWRVAYHDLLDNAGGYIPGAQISFFDLQLGVDQDGDVDLNQLYLLDAMSLAPDYRVFDSLSWNIRAGYDRQPDTRGLTGRYFMQGGYGKSWGDANRLHAYTLLSSELNYFDAQGENLSLGLGMESGLVWQANEEHKLALSAQGLYQWDAMRWRTESQASWHWALSQQLGLRTEVTYQQWQRDELSSTLRFFVYL